MAWRSPTPTFASTPNGARELALSARVPLGAAPAPVGVSEVVCAPSAPSDLGPSASCAVPGCPYPPSNHPTGRCDAHLDAWLTRVSEYTHDIGRGTR